jgi:hypothetical protein
MAYDVTFEIPERPLARANIRFRVEGDGVLLGTLKISKGAIVWTPADKKRGHKLAWAQFAELMQRRVRPRYGE